jgi:hypothetical protein
MSKMEQIEFHLDERNSVAISMFPPEQCSMRRSESPLFDGDRKVIAFPVQGISSRRAPGSRSWDATGDSKIAHFRRHRHASLSSKRTAKLQEVNSGKSNAATQNDDDLRHRMLENFLAAATLILHIIAGNWILR